MKKVLIVEDDPIVAHIYKTRLEKEGYEVEIATDGQGGFYRIHEFEPDAVLLDLMLPKMNGVEILKKIRAQAKFKSTPIIVFTNAYVANMINESFGAGATLVFNKATLTPRQILDALHNAIYAAPPAGVGAEPQPGNHSDNVQSTANPGHPVTEPWSESSFHSSPPVKVAGPAAPPNYGARQAQSAPETATAVLAPQADPEAEDSAFQADLLKTFLESAPETLVALRKLTQEFIKAQDETVRQQNLLELYRKVHALTGSAGIAGLRSISKMAAAVEVLLKDLYEKPKNTNASTMRTIAHSIDFLTELCNKGGEADMVDEDSIKILVADDEILSRRAITYALEKAGLKSVSVEESQTALNLATETSFDLIFLDVQMPGMDGFELCSKIRALPNNKNTPVIFVTSLADFKSRARSSLSGGADLIAKPFMFIELSVKALAYALRGQMLKAKK